MGLIDMLDLDVEYLKKINNSETLLWYCKKYPLKMFYHFIYKEFPDCPIKLKTLVKLSQELKIDPSNYFKPFFSFANVYSIENFFKIFQDKNFTVIVDLINCSFGTISVYCFFDQKLFNFSKVIIVQDDLKDLTLLKTLGLLIFGKIRKNDKRLKEIEKILNIEDLKIREFAMRCYFDENNK
jgi:hypothetical protein